MVSAVSPLNLSVFRHELASHPNQELVQYVLQGIRHGFRIGFDRQSRLKPANRNKHSAYEHPTVIDNYLANEVALGRVAGPFSSPPCLGCRSAVLESSQKRAPPRNGD